MCGTRDGVLPEGRGGVPVRRPLALLVVSAMACAAPALRAQAPVSPLTLSAALERAGRASYEAVSDRLDRESAREGTAQAKSYYLPSVTLDGGHTNLNEDPFFKFGRTVFPAGEQVSWKFQFAVREILWDGGRRKAAVEASRGREAAVGAAGADAVIQAQQKTLESYLEVVLLGERRAVVDQRLKGLEEHRRVAQDLFDQGVVARNDLLRTEVVLRNLGDQGAELANQRALALQALNRSMGEEPAAPAALPDRLPAPPPLPWDAEACKARALANNPGLRALEEKRRAEEEFAGFRKRDFYPTAVAQAWNGYEQNRYLLYPHQTGLFVGMSWSVFDGGARASKVREAQLEVQKTEARLADARRGVVILVDQAWRDYQQALLEAGTARLNEAAAVENLRILEDQYREGLVRTTDVLDAESVLAESRFTLAATRYRAYQRQGALLALVGENLPAFYANLPADAGTER